LKLLGVGQLIVAINKMDLVDFAPARYESVSAEYLRYLASIGLSPNDVLPVSARCGDNVARPSGSLKWFGGPTLLEALGRLSPRPPRRHAPFRLPIQGVYRFDNRRIIVGRVESGELRVGEKILFLPGGGSSSVKSIERWHSHASSSACAGESIGITLVDQLFIERGAVACADERPAFEQTSFRARVFWLGRQPLVPGRAYRLKLTTQELPCQIETVERVIDGATLVEPRRSEPSVERNEVAELVIRTSRPVVFDRFMDVPATGRFVLVDGYDIAGGGVVLGPTDGRTPVEAPGASALVRSVGDVSIEERRSRVGHGAAVVWLTGLSGSGKSTLARALERELFDRGIQVFVLDGDNLRLGLNRDLGFSAADRSENIRRVAEVAKLFAEAGMIVITAFISPYRSDRLRARRIMEEGGLQIAFLEVFLEVPLAVCEQRDPKGLYAKARIGQIKNFTGISDPYEIPEDPELTLRTADASVEECIQLMLDTLLPTIRPRARSGSYPVAGDSSE
jgi:bifunctional enzyme CysN/CysC